MEEFKTEAVKTDDVKRIVSLINEFTPTEAIVCLGKRSIVSSRKSCFDAEPASFSLVHYNLLMISKEQVLPGPLLEGKINNLPGLHSRVNLLPHTVDEVVKSLKDGNGFFGQAIVNGEVLQGEEYVATLRGRVNNINPGQLNTNIYLRWHCRLVRAQAFTAAVQAVRHSEGFEISLSLLSQCLEQVCLGVLLVCLDYQPKVYTLSHLLALCTMVSADFEDIIPRRTQEDELFFKILEGGFTEMRYSDEVGHDMATIQLLDERCDRFIFTAEELCEMRLGR